MQNFVLPPEKLQLNIHVLISLSHAKEERERERERERDLVTFHVRKINGTA